ncbi:MAG: helix-turn-helix transcriptional regulator, partial [Clostridia bacterium]|nr:helix-turn-helix transcriptional regulator [Clostridia bacterium]
MIAEKIKYLREAHHMTQSELAKKIGLSRSGVNAWEMGITVPSTLYIVKLAQMFHVSSDYLLGIPESSTISVS